jgi:hypothetical protein
MENNLKEYIRIWRIRQEYFALPYMDNTPIDIKLSLSQRIFEKNPKNFGNYITSVDMIEWAKTVTRYCPFKGLGAGFFMENA